MAGKSYACAATDPGAGVGRADVILALFNAFVCADALVLVRFHKIAHSHDLIADNDAVVRRVCVGVLPCI